MLLLDILSDSAETKGVIMFKRNQVKPLQGLEIIVYDYIINHPELVKDLTIRQLAEHCHVSPTTISRFCSKMGYQGFSEMKYDLETLLTNPISQLSFAPNEEQLQPFYQELAKSSYQQQLKQAEELIKSAEIVLFVGIGSSGALAEYGGRIFSDRGKYSYTIRDPFFPLPTNQTMVMLVIALSVSGETKEVIKQVLKSKKSGAKIISITANKESTLARQSGAVLHYQLAALPLQSHQETTRARTQVPVITLLEILSDTLQSTLE